MMAWVRVGGGQGGVLRLQAGRHRRQTPRQVAQDVVVLGAPHGGGQRLSGLGDYLDEGTLAAALRSRTAF